MFTFNFAYRFLQEFKYKCKKKTAAAEMCEPRKLFLMQRLVQNIMLASSPKETHDGMKKADVPPFLR